MQINNIGVESNMTRNYSGFNKFYPTKTELSHQCQMVKKLSYQPLISILIPTFNTPPNILRDCLGSVQAQTYPKWQLCIADDCSLEVDIEAIVKPYIQNDPRICFIRRKKHGHISRTLNDALSLAKGDFTGLLDHDDILWPNALFEVAKAIQNRPLVKLIITDEDQVSEDGLEHIEPIIKPNWNFHYLRTTNYIIHFVVVKTSLLKKIGGFRTSCDGCQDHDMLLRLTRSWENKTSYVLHIPKILYSWRRSKKSMAKNQCVNKKLAKRYAYYAQKRALQDDLTSRGEKGTITPTKHVGYYIITRK